MAAVTAQSNSNTDVWTTYADWKADESVTLTGASATEKTSTISSDYAAIDVTRRNWKDILTSGSTASSSMYTMDVTKDTVIKGSVAVNFKAATTNGEEITTPRGETKAVVDHDNLVDIARLDHDNYVGVASTGETVQTPDADLIDRDGLMVSAMLVDIAPKARPLPPATPTPPMWTRPFWPKAAPGWAAA